MLRSRIKDVTAASLLLLLLCCQPHSSEAWFGNSGKKVLLKDVQVLTLHSGKMTQGYRSSAVPQLECVAGGSAPCGTFKPRVAQCINRGFDGLDVQWECKTDMDNNVRFGSIDVSCEGYEYPEDPYILAGSCGLRYNLDSTTNPAVGRTAGSYGWNEEYTSTNYKKEIFSAMVDILSYCAMGLMAWAFYKTFINPSRVGRNTGDRSDSTTNDDYPAGGGVGWNLGGGGFGGRGGGYNNRGYGFTDGADASCHNRHRGAGAGAGGGGFWTGPATAGLLGYMMGGNRGYNRGGGGWFGNGGGYNRGAWGGGGGGLGGGGRGFRSSSGGGGSSGTRSASGFGGTSRR